MSETEVVVNKIERDIYVGISKSEVEKYLESNGYSYQIFFKEDSLVDIEDTWKRFESIIIVTISAADAGKLVHSVDLITIGFREDRVVEVSHKRRYTGP